MKKFFFRMLLLALVCSVGTATFAQKKALTEDFESGALPSGWTTTNSLWRWSNGEAQFIALVENGADTLFTPRVNISSLENQPTVTIDYRMVVNQERVNPLTVLYRTAATPEWTVLKQIETPAETSTRVYLPLPANVASATDLQLALAAKYLLGGQTAIDYLAIENNHEVPNAPTDLQTEELTSSSAALRWSVCNSDYFVQYNLKVSTFEMTNMTDVADVFDGNTRTAYTTLDALSPNTQYFVYLRYECEDEDYSPWATFDFRTPCSAVTLPLTQDFEQPLSNCYTILKNSKTTAAQTATFPYNSQKAFSFVTTKNTYNYLFFPEAQQSLTGYQVSFMVACELGGTTYGRELTIGVSTDATAENFTEVKTITLPQARRWEKVTISLAGYKGTGKILAFKAGNADKENHIVIDDVSIEPASACPMPMFVNVSEVTSNSAKLAWVEAGNATEWNLVLAMREYADPFDCEPNESKGEYAGSITTNPYVATNLLPNTTYYAYLQSACGESEWTQVYSFTTQEEVSIPYQQSFDRLDPTLYSDDANAVPPMWLMGSRLLYADNTITNHDKENSDRYLPYVSTVEDHTASAYVPAALLLRGTSLSSYWNTSYAMMPAMPCALNQLLVSFYAKTNDAALKLVVGVANTQTTEMENGQQLSGTGNVTPVDTLSFSASSVWEQKSLSLADYAGTGKYITFWLVSATATPTVYIDDIRIDYAPTCFPVQNLTATATATTAAKVTWTETLKATAWNIKVSTTEIDPATQNGDVVSSKQVTAQEYALSGLTANTKYYVYVSPACGDQWASTSVTTLYALTVPYYNDFTKETAGKGKAPAYWITGNMGNSSLSSTSDYLPNVYNTAWSAATGYTIPSEVVKNSLRFYAYYNSTASKAALQPYIILPELSGVAAKDLTLSFWGWTNNSKITYCKELKIGVMTDPTNVSTLTEVASVTLDTLKVAQYFFVPLSAYTGTGKYIVLYMDNQTKYTSYFFVDNLSITLSASPQRVTDVETTTVTTTSATIEWKENGNATNWEVALYAGASANPDEDTPLKTFTASTDAIRQLTGLTHSSQYTVFVRAVKGTEKGAWSPAFTFWTETDKWNLPFYENFDSYATGSTTNNTLPPYYEMGASTASTYPYVYKASSAVAKDPESLYQMAYRFYASSTKNNKAQLVLPALELPIKTLQMSMMANTYSTSYVHRLEVGVLPTGATEVVTITTLELSQTSAWEEWLVDFSSYTGGEGQIVLTCTYDATAKKSNDVMIDNLSIGVIPQCKKVQTISARAITQTGATISWEAAGDETAWNLKVSSTELADPAAATADMFDGAASTPKQMLSNLSADTEYFVYVQSTNTSKDCAGEWSQAFSFHSLCDAVARPYTETFDAMDKGIVPACYTLSGKVTDATAAATGQNTGATSQALKLSQVDKANTNYCAFPLVDCESIKDLQLAMQVLPGAWGTAGSESSKWSWYFYEVGIMTDPNDPTTYVAVKTDSVAADGSRQPVDKRYTFDTYAGDEAGKMGKYIAIKVLPYKSYSGTEYSGVIYVDNVTISDKETCIMPTQVKVAEYSNDTVRLMWQAEEKIGTFRVRIFDHADADFDTDVPVKDTLVTDTTQAVVRGLDGNMLYYATVRRECDAADGNSRWSTVTSWRSECENVQTLPYVETFEGYTANAPANCWEEIQMSYTPSYGGGGTQYVRAYVSTSAKKDGDYGLNLQYNSSKAGKAITPKLDVATLKDVVLYFDACSYSTSTATQLLIEAVESQDVDAASVTITTVDIPTSWQTIYLKLADIYTSAQPYQYLRFSVAGTQAIYMDNLHITTNPNEVVPVYALSVKDVRETSAVITFIESTPEINSWQVEYGVKDFVPGTGTVLTIDTTACTLTGLEQFTEYDVYVKSNVSGSAYVGPLSFRTVKPAAPLPYYYGFENADENANLWTLTNVDAAGKVCPNTFTFGDAANVGGTGNTSLYVQYNGQYGYCPMQADGNIGLSYVWATRNVEIPTKGTYVVGVKARCPGNKKADNETTDYMVVALAPAVCIPSGANIGRPDGTNGRASTTKAAYNEFNIVPTETICGVSDYTEFSGKAVITEPGIYQIMLYWYNPSVSEAPGTIYEPVAVDSVWVEEYGCTTPSHHHLTALSDTEAIVTWEAGANKNFEVIVSRYRKAAQPELLEEQDMVAHSFVSGEPVFHVANLLPNTTYALYQRTICMDGNTEWIEFDFTTECIDEQLPYTETFSQTPSCWTLSAGTKASTTKYLTAEMKENGEEAEVWTCLTLPANGLAVLPDFGKPVQQLGISMATFNGLSTTSTYTIGVMTDPWDAETFESVMVVPTKMTLSSSSSEGNPLVLETVQKLFNLYKGDGRYIAIKGDASAVTNIKYITVEQLPSCIMPMQVEITDIQETSVVVNWLTGTETQWQIACGVDTLTVSEQPFTLTGLQQGQTYSLAVRALCENNEESAWSQEVQFTTNCGVNAMPLTIDCDALADKAGTDVNFTLPNCWQQLRSTISLDSLNRQTKSATEVLERLPKQTTRNYYTYYDYKAGVPYQRNLDTYFGGKAHLMTNCFQDDMTANKGTYYKWLVLPAIEANEGTQLSFALAWANMQGTTFYNPNNGTYNPVEPVDFRIVVSEDGGQTYQSLQKIDLAQHDSTFQQMEVDLSAYAGKDIQVGFYHAMRYSYSTNLLPAIRLADVRINCTMNYPISDVACEGYDYTRNGFVISKDSLPAPMQHKQYTRFAANKQASGCDSIVTLTLTTEVSAVDTVYATICEGSSYSFGPYDLTKPNQEGQPYMLLGTTANGCDSTIYLYLSVTPAVRTSAGTKYINTGDTYDFNGKALSQTGVYYDTLRAANGCDSIAELHLFVVNKSIGYEEINVCANEMPLHWKNQVLTEAGSYRYDTLTTIGTDSVVTLTLNVLPTFTTPLGTKYINIGDSYAFNNKVLTQTGMYYDTLSTVNGCDSVLSLQLVAMAKQMGNVQMSVCPSELPFAWKDLTIDKAGVYTFDTLTTVGTDSVVTLTLTVNATYRIADTLRICEGDSLLWESIVLSKAGEYQVTYTSVAQCDSVMMLSLEVVSSKVIQVDTVITTADLPFVFLGDTILDVDTQDGTYDTTIVVNGDPCNTIYNLHISVKMGDGINNVVANELNIYPTMIAVGEKVNLFLPQADGLTVTIMDMTGNVMTTYHPATRHLVMDDFYTAGMYLVRVTSPDGYVGVGKVIAK